MFKSAPGNKLSLDDVRSVFRASGIRTNIRRVKDLEAQINAYLNKGERVVIERGGGNKYYAYDIAIERRPKSDCDLWQDALNKYRFAESKLPPKYWDNVEEYTVIYALIRTIGNKCQVRLDELAQVREHLLDNHDYAPDAVNAIARFMPVSELDLYAQDIKYIMYKIDQLA